MKSSLRKWSTKENTLLAVIWGAVIVTGFLALIAIIGGIESLAAFSRIHNFAVRLGFVYTAVHIYNYSKQIMSRLGIKIDLEGRFPKVSRIVKVINSLVFHIVLHIISVHLAVAYTVVHVFSGVTKLRHRSSL